MDKKTLTSLFADSLYQIPDYQRGYAWEDKQLRDFVEDIDALIDEQVRSHYTGTIVVYADRHAAPQPYGIESLPVVEIVDGQQRLTTVCLYLAVILHELVRQGQTDFQLAITKYLYVGEASRLKLNNETETLFKQLLRTGTSPVAPQTPHQKRLLAAYQFFQKHIAQQLKARSADGAGIAYLRALYHAITQQLNFTFYRIEEAAEIGMTFELMNSRGQKLSALELLKNYLMHWITRNEPEESERRAMTARVNDAWKAAYTNIGLVNGDEDQCLRIVWALLCDPSPSSWIGYEGFKSDRHIPLRTFTTQSKADTKDVILTFVDQLAEMSRHYKVIFNPTAQDTVSKDELRWLQAIRRTGYLANCLPILVAGRIELEQDGCDHNGYIRLLQAVERYIYRIYLCKQSRGHTGRTRLYLTAKEIFYQEYTFESLVAWVDVIMHQYHTEQDFENFLASPRSWYHIYPRLLKYTLFEYELHLLEQEGKGRQPHLTWEQLGNTSIEHILPQTPASGSHWKKVWPTKIFKECVDDIGNLVLTKNNANYQNFEFGRKKGQPGISPSYSDADLRQERQIARFADWTPTEYEQRRQELVAWINMRWQISTVPTKDLSERSLISEEDADDEE